MVWWWWRCEVSSSDWSWSAVMVHRDKVQTKWEVTKKDRKIGKRKKSERVREVWPRTRCGRERGGG